MKVRLVSRQGETVAAGELTFGGCAFDILLRKGRSFVYDQALTDREPDEEPLVYRRALAQPLAEGVNWKENPR